MNNWLVQSFIAVVLLIPAWLAIGFFQRNYQVKPESFLIFYFLGIIIMSAVFGGLRGLPLNDADAPSYWNWKIIGAILLVGLTAGAISNILLFKAVANAPNPGLPVALSNAASIGVFFVAILLYRWFPAHFDPVKTDIWSGLGLLLTVVGVAIISIRR